MMVTLYSVEACPTSHQWLEGAEPIGEIDIDEHRARQDTEQVLYREFTDLDGNLAAVELHLRFE